MHEAALRLSTYEQSVPDDGEWHIAVSASDGCFCGFAEFRAYPEYFEDFAKGLAVFPARSSDSVALAEGPAAQGFQLRAFIWDSVGHAALEILIDNESTGVHAARAHFHIPCEAAALNRLAEQLKRWISSPFEPMIWQPQLERL